MPAMSSPEVANRYADETLARGWRLLQPLRFGADDRAHVKELLERARFPQGARVLDIGSGFGECAALMHEARPDLRFTLVNFSAVQLQHSRVGERCLADAHALPFDDGFFNAAMFNYSLGNMDCELALREAGRVLAPGGVLFVNDLERTSGANVAMERRLMYRAHTAEDIADYARRAGLLLDSTGIPTVARTPLREEMGAAEYDEVFAGTNPRLWRFVKSRAPQVKIDFPALFARHERVALQFSGGKDSLALLHLMRPWWGKLTVYWCNPGDPFPETLRRMERVRELVPNFVEVPGRVREVVAADGWPSDVVPQACTSDGNFVFGPTPFKVQSRLSCCWRALMLPLHEAMKRDGATCILRGKRADEKDRTPSRSGETHDGFELVYPLWDWSAADVAAFLTERDVDVPAGYLYATHSLDCMYCTAWWGEGQGRYLKALHPEAYREYARRIGSIKQAVVEQMAECEV
jgi:phosphoadenosine phosphosulfate reductase